MCGAKAGGPDASTIKPGETTIQGQVTRDGEPVTGYVRLLDSTGEFTAEVPTSATGQFRFYAAEGTWTVRALVPGGTADRTVVAQRAASPRSPSPSDAATRSTAEGPHPGGWTPSAGAALRAVGRCPAVRWRYVRATSARLLLPDGRVPASSSSSAWAFVRLWSVPAAVGMCVVAMVIPPVAAMVANRRGPEDRWWDDPSRGPEVRRVVGRAGRQEAPEVDEPAPGPPGVTGLPDSGPAAVLSRRAPASPSGHDLLHEDLRARDPYALEHVLLRDVPPRRALGAQRDRPARQDRRRSARAAAPRAAARTRPPGPAARTTRTRRSATARPRPRWPRPPPPP